MRRVNTRIWGFISLNFCLISIFMKWNSKTFSILNGVFQMDLMWISFSRSLKEITIKTVVTFKVFILTV